MPNLEPFDTAMTSTPLSIDTETKTDHLRDSVMQAMCNACNLNTLPTCRASGAEVRVDCKLHNQTCVMTFDLIDFNRCSHQAATRQVSGLPHLALMAYAQHV